MKKKKKKKTREEAREESPQPPPAAPPEPESKIPEDIPAAKVILFWSFILFVILLSWILEKSIPVREAKTEHWLMLGMAAFLVYFLFSIREKKGENGRKI